MGNGQIIDYAARRPPDTLRCINSNNVNRATLIVVDFCTNDPVLLGSTGIAGAIVTVIGNRSSVRRL